MYVLEDQTYISEQPRHKRNTITQKDFKKSELKGPTQLKHKNTKENRKMNRINVSTRQIGKKMSKLNKRQQSVMFNDTILIPDEYQVNEKTKS